MVLQDEVPDPRLIAGLGQRRGAGESRQALNEREEFVPDGLEG